jgi:hypothetical protein
MSHSKASRDARARQAATGESYTRARRAVTMASEAPRLYRDEDGASTIARTLGFAQLMAAGAKARAFPAVHPGGAGAVVQEAITALWPRTTPEAVADVLATCADMVVGRGVIVGPGGYVSVLDEWGHCPVAADMLAITAEWAANGRPGPTNGPFTPPTALALSMAFDRDEDAAVLYGTTVLLALAHQRTNEDLAAEAGEDDDEDDTCDECGGELRGKGTYGCSCWNPTACDECGDPNGNCDCWI